MEMLIKRLLLCLLLLPSLVAGQSPVTKKHIQYLLSQYGSGSPPAGKTYVDFPTPPTFSDPNNLAVEGGDSNTSVFTSDLGGKSDQLLTTGQWRRMSLNGVIGTEATPIRFKSADPDNKTIIGDGSQTTSRCISTLNYTNHIEFYDLVLFDNQGGISFAGLPAPGPGVFVKVQDFQIYNQDFAAIWFNTANGYFEHLDFSFVRAWDLDGGVGDGTDGGEMTYIGYTTSSTRSKINYLSMVHQYSFRAAREGLQITSAYDLFIDRHTYVRSGTGDVVGQNRLFQFQDSNGVVRNSIFDGGTSSGEIFSHGITLQNNYYRWEGSDGIYIGDSNPTYAPVTYNNQPIIFENSTFDPDDTVPYLFVINEDDCDIIIRNNIISDKVTNIYQDNRVDKVTYSITVTGNTTTASASIDPVTYVNESETNLTKVAQLVDADEYYDRGMGYRTPADPLYPTDITLSVATIEEGNSINDVIGALSATVPSGTATLSIVQYGFRSGDHASFNISGGNLRASAVLDAADNPLYVRVRATNDADNTKWLERLFTIEVTGAPSAATDITLTTTAFDENNTPGDDLATFTDDAVPGATWSLVSGTGDTDNASFSIVGNKLRTSVTFDYETDAAYSIRVRSTTTTGSLTFEKQFSLTINDVLEYTTDVHFNFGPTGSTSVSGFVDAFDTTPASSVFTDSGITLTFGSNWSGASNLGENVTGYVPAAVSLTYFNLNSGNDATLISATITISGLVPSSDYTLFAFSSRNANDPRPCTFTADGESATIDSGSGGNVNDVAELNNVTSNGSGVIVLTLKNTEADGTTVVDRFAYLNALRIINE